MDNDVQLNMFTNKERDILICCFIWEKMAKKSVTYL